MPSPVAVPIELTEGEREQWVSWCRRRSSAQALALRARIVLAAADGKNNGEIAAALGVSRPMVTQWRSRFAKRRLDGLVDEPRPGQPRKIIDAQSRGDRQDAGVNATGCDALVDAVAGQRGGLTRSAVHRIWRGWRCSPTASRPGSCLASRSSDPLSIDKVRDVVGLYLNPPERAVVLSVDEKSQIQASDRSAPILPMLPGVPQRATHHYKRAGTSSLYAALDLTTGKVIGSLHGRHRAIECKNFLQQIDHQVPDHLIVHLVLDNASTHRTPAVQKWLTAHPRFVLHFTPTSSSWLNLVEIFFGRLSAKAIRRGIFHSVPDLIDAIETYLAAHNNDPQPFTWTATADQILAKVRRGGVTLDAITH